MKKSITILSIVIAFMACGKDNLVLETPLSDVENNEIKVNLKISRTDDFGSTKATVKSDWANNDVVLIFFKDISAPKYLEMKYNSSTDTWTSTAKNDLDAEDLSGAADKKMTAVYFPYGDPETIEANGTDFFFKYNTHYSGFFLQAQQVDYTYESGTLSGTLNMTAPELTNASDKLVHFDVSGCHFGCRHELIQDYVKPLFFEGVSADGVISINEGSKGDAILGHIDLDGSIISFSGILDESAVGNALDYQFSIYDLGHNMLYTCDAGIKTLNQSKYIGLGALNNTSVWNAYEYVDLGLSVKWATFNVGATKPEECGDFYAWGDIEPYYKEGYAQEQPQYNWKISKSDGYVWSNYKWCQGSSATITKYCKHSSYGYDGFKDNKTSLDPEDDVAQVKWMGNWRMPTLIEAEELGLNCTLTWTTVNGVEGCLFTSNKPGFTERSIFLPVGHRVGINYSNGSSCWYWLSDLRNNRSDYAQALVLDPLLELERIGIDRCQGLLIRPVCP